MILCSLAGTFLQADALTEVLSPNKKLLFEYDFRLNTAQSDLLQNAWISPILLQYQKNFSQQFTNQTVKSGSFTVGIDQPIFKSGGIYYSIKHAEATRGVNEAKIRLQKREIIAQAVKILFEIQKIVFEKKKLALIAKNNGIDIKKKKEAYEAGLLDSSFLDQAILKQNQDETRGLEIETRLMTLERQFAPLSNKDPYTLKLPKLKLISAQHYKGDNLALVRDKLSVIQKKYNARMTWAKYLPTVSLQARYTNEDLNPLFARPGIEEQYFTYGFRISMPLNINMFSDVEASKVAYLKAQTEVIERKLDIDAEYKLVNRKLAIIKKKIALSKKDEKLYERLYKTSKNLVLAGENTSYDSQSMHNSLKVKRLDKKIYALDYQIELLSLYTKVNNAI